MKGITLEKKTLLVRKHCDKQFTAPSKSKKHEDNVYNSASSGRPGSGGRSGARRGIKDDVRADLKRQKTVATANKRKSLFVQLQPNKVRFADGPLDLLGDNEKADHSSDRIDESDEENN